MPELLTENIFAVNPPIAFALLSVTLVLAFLTALISFHSYRFQSLPLFAGLAAAQLLLFLFLAIKMSGLWFQNFQPAWNTTKEIFSTGFWLFWSAHWVALAVFKSQMKKPPHHRNFLFQWLSYAVISLALIFSFSFMQPIVQNLVDSEGVYLNQFRQAIAGLCFGAFLFVAIMAVIRGVRDRAAIWLWTAAAALTGLSAIIFQYLLSWPTLSILTAIAVSSLFLFFGLIADRTRFLKLESELRRSLLENTVKLENKTLGFDTAMAFMNEAVVHVDLDGRITFANQSFFRLVGKLGDRSIGKRLKEIVPRRVYDEIRPAIRDARRSRTGTLANVGLNFGAEERVMQISYSPIFGEHERIHGVHLGLADVTNYVSAEKTLEESVSEKSKDLRLFQLCVVNVTDAIVVTDADHKIQFVNPAFERITGYSRREIIGMDIQAYRDPESCPWDEIKRKLALNQPWRGEVRGRGKDGRSFASDLSVVPIRNEGKQNTRYLWIERDITARQELASKLKQQTKEFEKFSERTREDKRRIEQLARLMKIGEDIRLNVGLEVVMQSVATAINTLGWQRVAVFNCKDGENFELVSEAGFSSQSSVMPRKFRKISYTELAPYLLERFRLSQSFYIDSQQLNNRPPKFVPKNLDIVEIGDWRKNDCLLVPIRTRDELAGMVIAFSPDDGRKPTVERAREVEIFADDAAIAIENSRLLELREDNERQALFLAKIGNTFHAAGTLENVVSDIAGIAAQALHKLTIVAVANEYTSNQATLAIGFEKRKDHGRGSLISEEQFSKNLKDKLFNAVIKKEIEDIEIAGSELNSISTLHGHIDSHKKYAAKIMQLSSRGHVFGFIAWIDLKHAEEWSERTLAFAKDLVDKATLTIDNTRLFLQTEEKAHELERANTHISEFLASVSHELRTPLHSILQFSEILSSAKPGSINREQKNQIDIIARSGKTLLALINDILDLSKIEAGKMEAAPEVFNPKQLIRETVEAIRPLCAKKSLKLKLDLDAKLSSSITSDRVMLNRILTNLLSNAVKFTDKGEIAVAASTQKNNLTISVRDSGIGIPHRKQKEIFEPFRQLESSEARRHGGTGLGLAISQRMLKILGGKIEVQSKVGEGTRFEICVPTQVGTSKPAKRKRTRSSIGSKSKTTKKTKTTSGILNRTKRHWKNGKPQVLVVEDDENTRYAMQFILEDEGYDVVFAEGGEEALTAAQHRQPDIILMDIMMPNMDGYQVSRALKSQKQLAKIPVVALTARAMKGDREKALAAGCDDYLTKPFEKKDILKMIEKWTRN